MIEIKMENGISRREALKRILLGMGGIMITPSALFAQCSNEDVVDLDETLDSTSDIWFGEDSFYIKRLGKVLNNIHTSFDIDLSSSERRFSCYSFVALSNNIKQCASLNMKRESGLLSMDLVRLGSYGGNQHLLLNEKLSDQNKLSEWDYSLSFSNSSDKKPFIGDITKGSGRLVNNQILINEGGNEYLYKMITGDALISWSMFELIEHFANTAEPIVFDSIDECDCYSGIRTLKPYKKAKIIIDKEEYTLYGWLLTGCGVVPSFFWLNGDGKLLFVNSGMNVFIRC